MERSSRDENRAHHGIGTLTLDFDKAAELDSTVVERGQLVLDYDTVTDGRAHRGGFHRFFW